MKKIILVIFCLAVSADAVLARDDAYRFVSALMDATAASPEWRDCLGHSSETEAVEPSFPTMGSLFAHGVPSNGVWSSRSVAERQQAFDRFLDELSLTNRTLVGSGYEATGNYALMASAEKGYTNSIRAARRIVLSEDAPCRRAALNLILKIDPPSFEKTDTVLAVATNRMSRDVSQRRLAVEVHSRELCVPGGAEAMVVTNAAVRMYLARHELENLIAVDELLLRAFPLYANSDNRLDLCGVALRSHSLTDIEQSYFAKLTNTLMSSGGRTKVVELP